MKILKKGHDKSNGDLTPFLVYYEIGYNIFGLSERVNIGKMVQIPRGLATVIGVKSASLWLLGNEPGKAKRGCRKPGDLPGDASRILPRSLGR